jgi:very-short-patch-repair endonuclease
MSKKLWGKEAVINDASKYQTIAEWRKNNASAYTVCCRNKWNDEACAHMTIVKKSNGYWTPERLIAESKKYKTTAEWNRSNPASYGIAKKSHLVPETLARGKIQGRWTKARIAEAAAPCETRGEFRSTFPSAYTIALNNSWIDDVCAHMLNKAPWFGPRIIREFLMRHDIQHHMEHKFKTHADVARYPFDFYLPDFNLVVEYHGRQHKEGWLHNPENAKEIQARDKIKKDFALREGMSYLEIEANTKNAIIKKLASKLTDIDQHAVLKERELSPSEQKKLKTAFLWNDETVREAISECKTIKEFREKFPSAHGYALKSGIWPELSKDLKRVTEHGKYTKEYVAERARQCKTRKEFRELFRGCWAAAQRNGWITEVCQHMPKHLQKPWLE